MNRRGIAYLLMVLLVLGAMAPTVSLADTDNLAELRYVGPGLYETEMVILKGGAIHDAEVVVGTCSIWNSRNELFVSLEADEGWVWKDIEIFVGNDVLPASGGANPLVNKFPYMERFKDGRSSYLLTLKLVEDLGIAWGRRDEKDRFPQIAVHAQVEDTSEKKGTQYRAWARGIHTFSGQGGYWSEYALVHPKSGHFVDAPVEGVQYRTPTQQGKTDKGGSFYYIEGEEISLYIGHTFIGHARADHRMTPMSLLGTTRTDHPAVVNMAMVLQSLDTDGIPKDGISIEEETAEAFDTAMKRLAIEAIDFEDDGQIDALLDETKALLGGSLTLVTRAEAEENLKDGTSSTIVRKNVSKTSEQENTKAKLEIMNLYVPAQKANGDPVTLAYYENVEDAEGNLVPRLLEERNEAKPLISCYTEANLATGADDVMAAVSRDEGGTWRTTNLSKSSDKSSFKLADGTDFYGDTHKPQIRVKGNYILAVWTSKYAKTGRPTYAIKINEDPEDEKYDPYDDAYYEKDIWGVSGPQRSLDYTELGYPEVGEIPFSVVWACRGVIDEATGTITWYKPERLTSGRRDANQIMMNGVEDVGFAVVWQEDPEGLRPGEQAGPGEGWSGATTNHKTDIWYSFVPWDAFDDIDSYFEPNGQSQDREEDEEVRGRPKAMVPFRLPVRISDNDTLNLSNMKIDTTDMDLPEEELTWVDVDASTFLPLVSEKELEGAHQYGYVDLSDFYDHVPSGYRVTDQLYYEVNNQGADKYIAITPDGRLMDGNTGASRPNIMLQKYTKKDGSVSAWVQICYEETKGVGAGPPDDAGSSGGSTTDAAITVEDPSDVIISDAATDGEGTGAQRGKDAYVADEGKNVIYHSFDLYGPDLVAEGHIINPQIKIDSDEEKAFYAREDGVLYGLDEATGLLYLTDEIGDFLYDWDGVTRLPAYENARRPRMIIQGKSAAIAGKAETEKGTVMVMVYKMGEEGKGRPSDIFMRRWEVAKADTGNPYAVKYLVEDNFNISSVSVGETLINENNDEDSKGEGLKVLNWEQTEENLSDDSWVNPYDDARAHRGILRGDMLAIALDWTPNWAAARNGNDIYNLYVRRSFDGGHNFTTDPEGSGVTHTELFKLGLGDGTGSEDRDEDTREIVETTYAAGAFEPMRNLSLKSNNKESVIEPRLVGGPASIVGSDYPEDQRDTSVFWVTYGTSTNPGKRDEETKEPLDLYYSYTTDFGETYYTLTKTTNPDSQGNHPGEAKVVWDWLAKDTGQKAAAQAECQIRMSPDGSVFYAVWNEASETSCDVMFRRIIPSGMSIASTINTIDDIPPIITVTGVNDGDVLRSDAAIDVVLSELGTWYAEVTLGDYDELTSSGAIGIFTEPFVLEASEEAVSYEMIVYAEDLSGNTAQKTLDFTIDSRVPVIEITGVTSGEYTREDVDLAIYTEGEETTITLQRDGGEVPIGNEALLSVEGRYALVVNVVSGTHTADRHVDFVIDKTAPSIVIEGVEEGGSYRQHAKPEVMVTDTYSTQLSDLTLLLNGMEYLLGTKISIAGDYELIVEAMDLSGNTATKTVHFTVTANEKTR